MRSKGPEGLGKVDYISRKTTEKILTSRLLLLCIVRRPDHIVVEERPAVPRHEVFFLFLLLCFFSIFYLGNLNVQSFAVSSSG